MFSRVIAQFLENISRSRENSLYLAMGDSIISDCYPGAGLGVASLLGQMLAPVQRLGTARTGYCLSDLEAQLSDLRQSSNCKVGLLSVGGNDLLALDKQPSEDWYTDFVVRYSALLTRLQQLYPAAIWLICNVYDPTDGTGQLPSGEARGLAPRPALIESLRRLNHSIARVAGEATVDLYSYCLGHGWSRRLNLWFQMDIEPNREGARQIAQLLFERLKVKH